MLTVRLWGRRPIILVGHILMAFLLYGIALTSMYKLNTLGLILILTFIFVYMTTTGPAVYVYIAETCSDVALGVVVFTSYFWETIETLTTETFNEIDPSFVFWLYGSLTFVSIPFIYFYIGETRGLSEKEKKEIFMPGANWGRELKEGEKPFAELGDEHKSRRTRKSEALSTQLLDSHYTNHTSTNYERDGE